MGDDHFCFPGLGLEVSRREETLPLDVLRGPRRLPDLRKDVCSLLLGSPLIDGVDQTVEGKLSAYRNENHRIEPWCCGPSAWAR